MIQRKNIYFEHLRRNVGINELNNFSKETIDMMLEREVVECFRKISNDKINPGEDDTIVGKNGRRRGRETFNMCKSLGILRTLRKCEFEAKTLLDEAGVYIFESVLKFELAEFLAIKQQREREEEDKYIPSKICHLLSCAKSSVMFDSSVKNINDVPCTCGREIKLEKKDVEKGFSMETFNHFNRIKKMRTQIPRVTCPSTEAYMVISPKESTCKIVAVNPETNELEEINKNDQKSEVEKEPEVKVNEEAKVEPVRENPIEYVVTDKPPTHIKSSSKSDHNENDVFEEGTEAYSFYENESEVENNDESSEVECEKDKPEVKNPHFLEEMGLSQEEIEELKQDRTVVKKIEGLNPGELRIRILNIPERRPPTTIVSQQLQEETSLDCLQTLSSMGESSSTLNTNYLGSHSFLEDPSDIEEDSTTVTINEFDDEDDEDGYEFRKRKHSPPLTAVGGDANNKKRMFTYYHTQGSMSSSDRC
uniref:SP-RING-type domain-containing protein n=2 Tax=Parastrongyloides trichosuri TaxID=131310 RepID=A0A0N4ZGL2_PARTI